MSATVQVLLGAGIIAVFLTQLIVTAREHLERKRERKGLLRILYSEFRKNRAVTNVAARFFQANMEEGIRRRSALRILAEKRMDTKAWEDTRVKLAHHLTSNEFAILDSHYRDLAELQTSASKDLAKESEETPSGIYIEGVSLALMLEIQQREQRVEQIIRRYVPDVTSDDITVGDLKERQRSLEDAD